MTLLELSLRFDNPYDLKSILLSAKTLGLDIPENYDLDAHKTALSDAGISQPNQIVPRGLGDTIANITHATGLDKLSDLYTKITGKPLRVYCISYNNVQPSVSPPSFHSINQYPLVPLVAWFLSD